jgi:hypothetical protein
MARMPPAATRVVGLGVARARAALRHHYGGSGGCLVRLHDLSAVGGAAIWWLGSSNVTRVVFPPFSFLFAFLISSVWFHNLPNSGLMQQFARTLPTFIWCFLVTALVDVDAYLSNRVCSHLILLQNFVIFGGFFLKKIKSLGLLT